MCQLPTFVSLDSEEIFLFVLVGVVWIEKCFWCLSHKIIYIDDMEEGQGLFARGEKKFYIYFKDLRCIWKNILMVKAIIDGKIPNF